MKFFENLFGDKKPENQTLESVDDINNDQPVAIERIRSTRDLRLATADGRLDEVEEYLLKELEHPSQDGHNDFWLNREFGILISIYKKNNALDKIDALKEKLPDHLKTLCEIAN